MRRWTGLLPAMTLVGSLSVAALAGLVSRSLRPGAIVGGSLGFGAWQRVLADTDFREAFWFTLRTSVVATLLALAVALPLGVAVRRSGPLVRSLMIVLLPVPHLVVASATVTLFGPGQLIDRLIGEVPLVGDRNGVGVIVVYLAKEIPFLTVLVAVTVDRHTIRLDEAARGLGASRWHRWRFVVLPRLAAPLGLGALVVGAFVIGSTEVPLVVGPLRPDTLTTYSLTVTRVQGPLARADAAVALVVASALICLSAVSGLVLFRRRIRT